MMQQNSIITSIEELDKKRVKVYINERFAFVLYKGELRSIGFKEHAIVTQQQMHLVTKEILPKRAIKRAMNLLQKKSYTEKQLVDKLKQGLYTDDAIQNALEYVKSYHYVDDFKYASDYISYYCESRSRRRIETDLLKKGIDKEIMQAVYSSFEDAELFSDELKLIQKEFVKKKFHVEEADYMQKQKMFCYLHRKGFQGENIRKALKGIEPFVDITNL